MPFLTGRLPDSFLRLIDQPARKAMGKPGQTWDEAEAKRLDLAERKLQDQIAQYLMLRGITFNRSRMDRKTTGKVGWPDFTFGVPMPNGLARAVALEVKANGRKPTAEQAEVMARLIAEGWLCRVVYSVEEVKRAVEEAGRIL